MSPHTTATVALFATGLMIVSAAPSALASPSGVQSAPGARATLPPTLGARPPALPRDDARRQDAHQHDAGHGERTPGASADRAIQKRGSAGGSGAQILGSGSSAPAIPARKPTPK